ncbi:MAG: hypothetical protein F4Z82_13155 [Caldilineaceae bacterium SB0668_bin_21]|nr:hypothetical protein [Caldilineaceae bacterium SB0668_bin_21]MYC21560.1 hypothetical protein [Caldilineaceae bacterium SB0662_bin_25]
MKKSFVEALKEDSWDALRAAPKVDLHCHAYFSTRRHNLESRLGRRLEPPPDKMNKLGGMIVYAMDVLDPHLRNRETIEFVAESALRDAIGDGVVMMEISFDIRRAAYYADGLTGVVGHLRELVARFQPLIELRPELGIPRQAASDPELMSRAHEAIGLSFFHSIDLYDHQEACEPEDVESLYAEAKAAGMKLKAHVGEFGGAEEVRRTVELLELDEVQHGIGAAESVEVMRWLAGNGIRLNVCPTSNVMLDAVPDMASHPIRLLFDNGVPVTVNSDDPMIFDQSVTDEYRNLYRAGVFSADELDGIRRASLEGVVNRVANYSEL